MVVRAAAVRDRGAGRQPGAGSRRRERVRDAQAAGPAGNTVVDVRMRAEGERMRKMQRSLTLR